MACAFFLNTAFFLPQHIGYQHINEASQAITVPVWKAFVWQEQFFSGQRLAFAVAAPTQARVWKLDFCGWYCRGQPSVRGAP